MKKSYLLILILMVFSFASCDSSNFNNNENVPTEKPTTGEQPNPEKPKECEHHYIENVVESTCSEYGYIEYTCKYCNDTYVGKRFDYLAEHDFTDWNVIEEGGCDTEKVSVRECKNCDFVEEEKEPATSHKYNIIDSKPSDCVNNGYEKYECENCHHTYTNTIPSTGHNYGPWNIVSPASCLEDGLRERECSCGDKQEEIIPKGEHNYVDGQCSGCGVISYLTFRLNPETNTYYVSDCDNSVTVVNIPSNINDIAVTGIYSGAFEYCDKITHIFMPDSITYMPDSVFMGCSSLESIQLSNNISTIPNNAFYECRLLENINLPTNLKTIGMNAFYCSGIVNINVVEGVTNIDAYAFSYCDNLKEVTLPSTVEALGSFIFDSSAKLSKITIPFIGSSILDEEQKFGYLFGQNEFTGSVLVKLDNFGREKYYLPSSLKEVVILGGSISYECFKNVTTIESIAINNCSNIDAYAFAGVSSIKNISINSVDGINQIGNFAFKGCTGLENIDIDCSVDTIGESVFSGCTYLKSIKFASVKTIKSKAFDGCSNLEDIYLPQDLEVLENNVFYNCTNIKNLELPFIGNNKNSNNEFFFYNYFGSQNVNLNNYITLTISNDENISNYSLQNFSKIKKIIVGDNTKTIGYGSFRYMSDLEEVVLSDNITTIGEEAFSNCTNLSKINLPKGLTAILNNTFYNCSSLEEIEIPSTITYISGFSYTNISKITIPSTVIEIGPRAFVNTKITEIEIPEGVTKIGYEAFSGTLLETIVIPDSVNYIDSFILSYCTNLKSLTIPFIGNSLDDLDNARLSYVFENPYQIELNELRITKGTKLEELTESIKIFEANENFVPDYNTINYPLDKLTIGFDNFNNQQITYSSNKIKEIYVIGSQITYGAFSNVSCDKVTVSETVKTVASYAFNSANVTEIEFVGDEIQLQEYPFGYCPSLKKLVIPSLGEYIINGLFSHSVQLEELVLTNTSYIAEYCFDYCEFNIKILGDSLKEIESNAFNGYLGGSITLPSSVTKICANAFNNTSVDIVWDNPTIEVITSNAFTGYMGTEVIVPKSVNRIDGNAFEGYEGAVDLGLVEELVLGDKAFYRYLGTNIVIPSFVKEIGAKAFANYSGTITWDNPTIEVIKTNTFADYYGQELVIPNSVITIEEHAMTGNKNLTKLTIPFVGMKLDSEVNYSFNYTYDNLVYTPKELTINNGSIIRKDTFLNVNIEVINLPNTLQTIEEDAFKYCGVQKLIIPSTVTTIERAALNGCSNLIELGIPFLGTSKEDSLFIDLFGDSYLDVVYQYKDGKYIYGYKPQYLEILHINGTEIKDYALFGFDTIKVINIDKTVKHIGVGAFIYCDSLTDVNYYGTIDEWSSISIGSSPMEIATSFSCLDTNNQLHTPKDVIINNEIIKSYTMTNMPFNSITLDSNVSGVEGYAFKGYSGNICFNTTKITQFEDYAFSGYNGQTITIPSSVLEGAKHLFEGYSGDIAWDNPQINVINTDMFYGYKGSSVVIPNSVTTIEKNAFRYCDNLLSITIPNSVISVDNEFTAVNKINEIYNLSNLSINLNNVVIHTNMKNSIISVVGDYVFAYKNNDYYLVSYLGNNSNITLPANIDGNSYIIDSLAFYNNTKLYSINLGSGVKEISLQAFEGCTRLVQIVNPNNIELPAYFNPINEIINIEDNGLISNEDFVFIKDFSDKYYLIDYLGTARNVVLPNSINNVDEYSIYDYAFYKNNNLYSVSIPYAVKSIGRYAFAQCTYLQNVIVVGDDIKQIKDYAFYECRMLLDFSKLSKVEIIGEYAFASIRIDCLDIQGTYELITYNVFKDSSISKLVLSLVTEIKDNAFNNAYVDLYYIGTKEQYDMINIGINNNVNNIYYYSIEEPVEANCWYYSGSMIPTLW